MKQLKPHILPIYKWPADELHQIPQRVVNFNNTIEQASLDMLATIRVNDAFALAGPQVGIDAQIIAILVPQSNTPMIFVNPEIIEVDDKEMFEYDEGCLSIPGYFEKRSRPYRVVLKYQEITGEEKTSEFLNFFAFLIQHEMEHLEGKLFIDGASTFKKTRIKMKMRKYLKKNTKK